jgi:tight adherence protein B
MQTALYLLIGLNIILFVASRMKKSATDTGLTVDDAQLSVARSKQERFAFLGRLMRGKKGASQIERNLVTAGLLIKPSEFYMINFVSLGIVTLIGLFFVNRLPYEYGFFPLLRRTAMLGIAVGIGFYGPRLALQFMANQRRSKLEFQLADALAIISSALRGGFSFVQGLDMASQQLEPPVKDEFARVIRLVQLGLDTSRALEQMAERVNSYDYSMTVSATNIQLSVGGNLSQMLDSIAQTIRERIRLRREIAALTAQGRISGAILIGLPVAIALMLKVINPEYMGRLTNTPTGGILLYVWVIMQGIGIYWIKKLLDFDN